MTTKTENFYSAHVIENAGSNIQAVEIRGTDSNGKSDPKDARCVRFHDSEMRAVFLAMLRHYAETMSAGQLVRMLINEIGG